MYRVTMHDGPNDIDGLTIHSPFSDSVKTSDGKAKLGINAIDTFSFTIFPNSPGYTKIKPLLTLIKVYDTKFKRYIFEGRVLTPSSDFSAEGVSKSFICESELGYLQDSIQSFRKVQNTTPKQLLQMVIDVHNSQVEPYKQFKIGEVDVTNTTDNVYRYIDDTATTYDTIMDKLVNREALGGEIRARKVNGQLYLDWLQQIGYKSEVDIRLAKNLIEMTSTVDPTSIVTRLYPRGERVTTDDNQSDASHPRLTIKDVNNGKEYIDASQELINVFGIQGGVETYDDVTKPDILLSKGKKWLENQLIATGSYRIKAADLGLINLDTETYQAGNIHHVYNPLTSTDSDLRIIDVTIPINNPAEAELSFGDKAMTMSQYQASNKKATQTVKDLEATIVAQTKLLANTNQALSEFAESTSSQLKTIPEQIKALEDKIKALEGGSTGPTGPVGKIIDISEWQGVVDFNALKSDGVELVIIRVQHGSNYQDMKYMENIQKCITAGIRYAVYAYCAFTSEADARVEATDFYNRTQRVVSGKTQPVFYMADVEEQTATNMRLATTAFNDQLVSLGVAKVNQVVYIAHHLYTAFNIDTSQFGSVVLPSYGINDGTVAGSTEPLYPYDLWQYTSTGRVAGISGNVDLNTNPSERFKKNYLGR